MALLRDSYAKAFERAFQQGILNLVGIQSQINTELYDKKYLLLDGIAVIIGLTGDPTGRAIMYMNNDTMKAFAKTMLGTEDITEDEITEAAEEAANIVMGRGVSNVNNVFKDKEMRITPPGTIYGTGIRITSPKLTTFKLTASTKIGEIYINIGFAEGE